MVRDHEAAGSSPATPTISSVHKGSEDSGWTLAFFVLIFMYRQAMWPAILLCGDVLHRNTLPGICLIISAEHGIRNLNVPHKSVMDDDALSSGFADAFHLVYFDVVN